MEHSPGWNTSEGAFDDLTSLEYLTLSANRLTELNEGVFDNITDVKHLYFSRNRLASRPEGAFDGLSELNYLSIYRNRLTELADSVVADLDTLPVSFNRLSELPDDVLGGLDDLDLLNLGGQPVDRVARRPSRRPAPRHSCAPEHAGRRGATLSGSWRQFTILWRRSLR